MASSAGLVRRTVNGTRFMVIASASLCADVIWFAGVVSSTFARLITTGMIDFGKSIPQGVLQLLLG